MELFPDQIRCAEEFKEWLLEDDSMFAGLWASAGYGKSWSAKYMIEEIILKHSNYTPVITSLTHSAVEVLEDFTKMGVTTLHSFMKWVPIRDKDTGEEGLSTPKMRNSKAENITTAGMLLLIDEAGLMGHNEVELLRQECEETGCRVLFMGDHKQCFPVLKEDEKKCIPAYDVTEKRLHLTIPKRADKDNYIFKLSEAYRRCVDGDRQPRLRTALNADNFTGVRVTDDIELMAYRAFTAAAKQGDTKKTKVLAFTNKRCLTLNRKIRRQLLGHRDPTPEVGEEMVANTAIQSSVENDMILIKNNERLIVKSVEKTTSFGLEGAFVQYTYLDGEDVKEIVFVPATPAKLLDRKKQLANEANALKRKGDSQGASKLWRTFYALSDGCADIRFTYAMTVNKAQGVTLKHALVDLDNINICKDKEQAARLAYTAVSRATDFVTIEGELT